MLTGTLNKIRAEKAKLYRDVLYIREMAFEDLADDRLLDLELKTVKESGNIFTESAETIDQISSEDDFSEAEINRILNSDRSLALDEVLGI